MIDPATGQLLTSVLGSVVGGIVQGARKAGGAYADVEGQRYANTAAEDPRNYNPQMIRDIATNFGADSQFGRAAEASTIRQDFRNFNQRNKESNEALKRSYVADSYKQAMQLGAAPIDNYLARARANDQILGQIAMMRY